MPVEYLYSVLIIDDNAALCDVLSGILNEEGYQAFSASSQNEALEIFQRQEIHAVMLDLMLPGTSGLVILQELKSIDPLCPVIMMSGHSSIQSAVEATKNGAFDWLEKPLEKDRILVTVRNAVGQTVLAREKEYFHKDIKERYKMVGSCPAMQKIYTMIDRVAPTNTTVLISGETGTGKELVARALHYHSTRAARPFVEMNCAAVPEGLIESELFGHTRGSFTGAHRDKKGMFQMADTGTLLLDEIGDLSLSAQAKVLRALETGEVIPVGCEHTKQVNIRFLAATNKDLAKGVQEKTFREDLFHRINVIAIDLPSLRDRVSDIPDIFNHFLKLLARESGSPQRRLSEHASEILQSYHWPGNIRELRNIAEKAMVLIDEEIISGNQIAKFLNVPSSISNIYPVQTFQEARHCFEKNYILHLLKTNNWNISKTAEKMNVSRSLLYKKMDQYSIEENE